MCESAPFAPKEEDRLMPELRITLSPDAIRQIAEEAAQIVLEQQQRNGSDKWLDIQTAAEYSGASTGSVHRAIRDGELQATQPGGPNTKLWTKASWVDRWRGESV
jgi:hypothetical protein